MSGVLDESFRIIFVIKTDCLKNVKSSRRFGIVLNRTSAEGDYCSGGHSRVLTSLPNEP